MVNSAIKIERTQVFGKQYLSSLTDEEEKSKGRLNDFKSLITHITEKNKNAYELNGIDWLVDALEAKSTNLDNVNITLEQRAFNKLSLNENNYCITGHKNWPRGFQKAAIAVGYIMDNGAHAFKYDGYLDTDGIRAWLKWNKKELIKKTGDESIVQDIMNELNDKYFKNIRLNNSKEVVFAEKSQYSECSIKLDDLSPIHKRNEIESLEKFLTTYSDSDELPSLINWVIKGFSKTELNKSPTTLLNKIMTYYFCKKPVQKFNYDSFLAWLNGFEEAAGHHILNQDNSMEIDLSNLISELVKFTQVNKSFINTLGKSLQYKDYGSIRSQITCHAKREQLKTELDKKLPISISGNFLRTISDECISNAHLLIKKADPKAIDLNSFGGNAIEKSFLQALQNVYETFSNEKVGYDYTYLTDKYNPNKNLSHDEVKNRENAINKHTQELKRVITQHLNDIEADIRISLNATNNNRLNSQANNLYRVDPDKLSNAPEDMNLDYKKHRVNRNLLLEESEFPFDKQSLLKSNNTKLNLSNENSELNVDNSIARIHSLKRKTTFREHRDSFIKERKVAGGAKKCLIKLDNGKFYVLVSDIKKANHEYLNEEKMKDHLKTHPELTPYCSPQVRVEGTEFAKISSIVDPTYAKYLSSEEFKGLDPSSKKAEALDMIKSYHSTIFKFLENEATHGDYHLENGKRNQIDPEKKR